MSAGKSEKHFNKGKHRCLAEQFFYSCESFSVLYSFFVAKENS